MPNDPTLPTNVEATSPTIGHKSNTDVVHGVINSAYKATIGTTRTASFTIAQSDSGEVIPCNSASTIDVTVPSRAVGTSVELIRQGAGALTVTASGVTFLLPTGATAAARVQGSSITLLWLTTTLVSVGGDLT